MIGKTIGKYRIVGQLGRGGMGTVYKAVDEVLDREVAIKVLNAELADTTIMQRFRAEATALARLNHSEIASIYELFRSDTDLLMVMELVRGETLDKISARLGALPPEHAAYLIDKVLSALAHAHRAGIVHCDMKPANVMVTAHGGVKIMDFGVARVRGAGHPTVDGYMVGTPAYMPPEQVFGQEVDGRADLYSVGVIFYRLLTGTLPFEADTAIGMVQKQISDAPTPLRLHCEGLPDWCETIVQRALAKSPADRFQTAEEFRETLGKATGMVAMDLTKAFSISILDLERMTPSKPGVLERFGLTPVPVAAGQMPVSVGPNPSGSLTGSARDAAGIPPAAGSATPSSARSAESPTIVLPRRQFWLAGSVLAILAGGITVLAIVALWRTAVAPTTRAAAVPRPAPAAVPPRATGAVPSPAPDAAPPPAIQTSTVPRRARPSPASGSNPPAAEPTATSSSPAVPVEPAGKTFAAPFVFEARTLVRDGNRYRERKSRVVLADGTIRVRANDDRGLLHVVPYDEVLSISYSRGIDPLWNAPAGPRRVTHPGGGILGALGIFVERHWVSLRTAKAQFVVLRLGDEEQAKRVITALEERTGRRGELVAEPEEDK